MFFINVSTKILSITMVFNIDNNNKKLFLEPQIIFLSIKNLTNPKLFNGSVVVHVVYYLFKKLFCYFSFRYSTLRPPMYMIARICLR